MAYLVLLIASSYIANYLWHIDKLISESTRHELITFFLRIYTHILNFYYAN